MSKFIVLPNQTIFDIALQESGSIESVFEIMKTNSLGSLLVVPLSELQTPSISNKKVNEYYLKHNIRPASTLKKRKKSFNKSFNISFS